MSPLGRLTIRQRLLIVGLLPAVVIALAVSAYFIHNASSELDRIVEERGLAIVSFLAPASEYGLISGNRETLGALLQAALTQRQVHAAAIIDQEGRTLAVSGATRSPPLERLRKITAPDVLGPLDSRLRFAAPVWRTPIDLGELFDQSGERPRDLVGWVYAELDTSSLSRRKSLLLLMDAGLVLLALLATAALATWIARALSRPLSALASAVEAMAMGRHETRVEAVSGGELGGLERGFNQMAEALEDVHRNLQARIDQATEKLRFLAEHDPLSQLPNRRAFERETEDALEQGPDRGHALCFIDLDRFKIVNDTCGHLAGDELLCRVGRLLRDHVREQDMVARVGGDEFALLLRDCGADNARRIADSLRETVAAFRFSWDGREFAVGASIGLVMLDRLKGTLAQALSAADHACYEAKRAGRNQVCETSLNVEPASRTEPLERLSLASALESSRLELLAHALLPGADDDPAWAEVVLRLDGDEDAGRLFVEHCARAGEGLALETWLVNSVCRHLKRLSPSLAAATRVSFDLRDDALTSSTDYLTVLREALMRSGVQAQRLGVQISADRAAQYPAEAMALAARLRALGTTVLIGGYRDHAPALLKALRPDYVNIDLAQMGRDYGPEQAAAVAGSAAAVASALGIRIVLAVADADQDGGEARRAAAYLQFAANAPLPSLEAWLAGVQSPQAHGHGQKQA